MVIKQYYKNKMIALTLLCVIIYIYLNNYENARIKLNNFKQKQHQDLCKYLSNNIIFYNKEALTDFMINQYYEMVIFRRIQILNEQLIINIYTNATLNSNTIRIFYRESCL